jgi:rare lipoprotein A
MTTFAYIFEICGSKRNRTDLRLTARMVAVGGVILVSTGCLHRHHPVQATRGTPSTTPAPIVQGERGIASWYGHPYHGRPTANGEIYNMYGMTAAHRTLPFGTRVNVHDLENGREVTVRINDRGPFIEGRIIDLSYAAAQAMHMSGIAQVWLEILGLGEGAAIPGIFAVQVGAFRDQSNAKRLKDRIESQFGPVIIQDFDRGDGLFYRVRVGRESTEDAAHSLAQSLRRANLATETFVVRLN